MTLVNFSIASNFETGLLALAGAQIHLEPSSRFVLDSKVILPRRETLVTDTNGHAEADLQPTPADMTWLWVVTESWNGRTHRQWVAIPDSDEPVDYATLTPIDPSTLNPTDDTTIDKPDGWRLAGTISSPHLTILQA